MNAKTAKLIRRWCTATGQPYRPEKRAWNRSPKRQRFASRQMMRDTVAANA